MRPRHRRFVTEYLIDLNGTQAAIRAGYARSSANRAGYRLLRRPDVVQAVRQAMAKREERTLITADRVLKEYARIAFADIRRLTEWGPAGVMLKPHTALSDDDAAAIAEITVSGAKPGSGSKLKLHDKKSALDSIARHLGLFDGRSDGIPGSRSEEASRAREMLRSRIAKLASDKPDE